MRLSLPDLASWTNMSIEPDEVAGTWRRSSWQGDGRVRLDFTYRSKGEAAFYGPKIEFMIKIAIGTRMAMRHQCSSISHATETFGAEIYRRGRRRASAVYVIHRAPLGTHGALHGVPDRALCRRVPALAGAGPGARRSRSPTRPTTMPRRCWTRCSRRRWSTAPRACGWTSTPPMSGCRRRSATPSCRKSPTCWWWASGRRQKARSRSGCARGKDLGAMPLESFHRPHQTRGRIPAGCGRIALAEGRSRPILASSPADGAGRVNPRASARKAPFRVHDRTSFRLGPTDRANVDAHGCNNRRES